jgi:transcriptional regulator with XRE-family HTH domain
MKMDNASKNLAENTIAYFHQELGLSYEDIGKTIGVSRQTVNRWRNRNRTPSRDNYNRLEKMSRLQFLLDELFELDSREERFLSTPSDDLEGHTPLYMIREGDIEPVIELLSNMASGTYQ